MMHRRDVVLQTTKDHLIFRRPVCVLIGADPKTVRREHPQDNRETRLGIHKIAKDIRCALKLIVAASRVTKTA